MWPRVFANSSLDTSQDMPVLTSRSFESLMASREFDNGVEPQAVRRNPRKPAELQETLASTMQSMCSAAFAATGQRFDLLVRSTDRWFRFKYDPNHGRPILAMLVTQAASRALCWMA